MSLATWTEKQKKYEQAATFTQVDVIRFGFKRTSTGGPASSSSSASVISLTS
jgi:hypothetical protein